MKAYYTNPSPALMRVLVICADAGHGGAKTVVELFRHRERDHA